MKELNRVESVDLSDLLEEAGLEAMSQGNFNFAQSLLEGSVSEAEQSQFLPKDIISKILNYASLCEINGCFDEALRAYEKVLNFYLQEMIPVDDNIGLLMKNLSAMLKRCHFDEISAGMEACAEVVQSLVFQHCAATGVLQLKELEEAYEKKVA